MSKDTSWESSEDWYNRCVGEKGHYYHEAFILKNALDLLQLKQGDCLIDIGCGQGVLERSLPPKISYLGIDKSKSLIANAKKNGKQEFLIADACQALPVKEQKFDAACFILSLQNMEFQKDAIMHATHVLKKSGKLLLVLNHPCFRIPRQSSWGIDENMKLQYRRLNVYMTQQKIPIQTHPSQKEQSATTFSFHHPLSDYIKWLSENHLVTLKIEEWCSDKKSQGSRAKMEDRARKEFPLFLAILAEKVN